jgi:hypothetical protein
MNRFQHLVGLLGITALLTCLIVAGCAGPKPKAGEVFPCASDSKIEKTIAPEAELTDFSCVLKKWEGSDTLHFNVTLKNISDQPQRYRVNIFLDNGKAVGGLIPTQNQWKGWSSPGKPPFFCLPGRWHGSRPQIRSC